MHDLLRRSQQHQTIKSNKLMLIVEMSVPWLLPILLIFSRALADITVLSLGLIFLFKCHQEQDWFWLKNTWFKLNIVFWAYLLFVNTPLSINVTDSLLHAFFYLRWPLFSAALAYWIFNDEIRQKKFLIALSVVSTFVVFDTALQYINGVDIFGIPKFSAVRLTGPFSAPVPGIMMLRVLFITLFLTILFDHLKKPINRILLILTILIVSIIFMLITGERMAFILFLTGSIVVLIGLGLEQKAHQSKLMAGFAIMITLVASLLLLAPDTAERSVYSIYTKLIHFADSDYGLVFRAAFEAWKHAPIFGSGIHSYRETCEQIGLLPQWGIACSHPHNLYLQIAAETGLVGLVLFVTMVGGIFYTTLFKLIRSKQWLMAGLCFTVLYVSFWPLIGGISILNNGVAALVWLGVGWVLSMAHVTSP